MKRDSLIFIFIAMSYVLILFFCTWIIGDKFKYWTIGIGAFITLVSDLLENKFLENKRTLFKTLGALTVAWGIVFTYIEDENSNKQFEIQVRHLRDIKDSFSNTSDKFATLLQAADLQRDNDSIQSINDATRFSQSLKSIENLNQKARDFQYRLQNPLPEEMYLSFSHAFDISKSTLYPRLKEYKISFIDRFKADSIGFVKRSSVVDNTTGEVVGEINNYLFETQKEVILRFSKNGDTMVYRVNYNCRPDVVGPDLFFMTPRFELIFPIEYTPFAAEDFMSDSSCLKLTRFGTGSFISVLDFKDADVEIIFGQPFYDRINYKMKNSKIKAGLKDVKVWLHGSNDFIEITKLNVSEKNDLKFTGKVTSFVIRSKLANSPMQGFQ